MLCRACEGHAGACMGSQLVSIRLEEPVLDKVDRTERTLRPASHATFRDVRDESPPHIFVIDPHVAAATELADSILQTRERDLFVSVAADATTLDVDCAGRMFSADLVLLRLGAGDGFANAIALTESAPWISPVFWV